MRNRFLFLSVQTLQARLSPWFLTSLLHHQIFKQLIPVLILNFFQPWREPLLTPLQMALLQSVVTHLLHPCVQTTMMFQSPNKPPHPLVLVQAGPAVKLASRLLYLKDYIT